MQILVSFCNLRTTGLPSLGLLDPVTFEFRVVRLPDALSHCRGITGLSASGHDLYLAAQDTAHPGENGLGGQSVLFILDRDNLAVRDRYVFRSATDVHSLCCHGDVIYAVSTGTDEIVRLEVLASRIISETTCWRPDPEAPRQDIHHLNAILARDEGLFVAGFGKKSGVLWDSARNGFILNITNGESIASHIDQPHSILCTELGTVYCESRRMAVRLIGTEQHRYLPGYTRGLCSVGRELYVATSVGRQISKSSGAISNPAERGTARGNCTISRLSLRSFALADTLTLDEYASEVYDLLPLEGTENWPTVCDVAWRRNTIHRLASALDDRTRWAQQSQEELADRNAQLCQLRADKLGSDEMRGDVRALRELVERQGATLNELRATVSVITDIASQALARWAPDFHERAAYLWMIQRIRDVVEEAVPPDSTVLVAAKGDDALLQFQGSSGWHFPQSESGAYTGNHPSCNLAAIAHLEALRALGATHFVVPATALWWLDYYVDFWRHVKQQYTEVFQKRDTCVIYDLTKRASLEADNNFSLADAVLQCRERFGDNVALLNWNAGVDSIGDNARLCIFSPPEERPTLPYFDHSVDIVAIPAGDSERYAEACRVASAAVLTLREQVGKSSNESYVNIEWLKNRLVDEPVAPTVTIVVNESEVVGDLPPWMDALQTSLPRGSRGEIIAAATWGRSPGTASNGHRRSAAADVHDHNGRVQSVARPLHEASGDILIFLSAHLLPLPDWLPPLLASFEQWDQVGVVDGRLIGGDGRLHSAGGVIFADASVVGFGAGDYEPEAPLFEFVRQIDCCVGRFLATRRSLFDRLQGFDPGFQSADLKFADYCLRARDLGYLTIYQPETKVVCLQARRCANEPRHGGAANFNGDEKLFRDKWLGKLRRQAVPPGAVDREAWHAIVAMQAWYGERQS